MDEETDPSHTGTAGAATSRHRRRASARVRTTSPCFGAPQLVGAGAVHRAQDSVRQELFLNSAHHTMSRRCSTFQLFACHHKHVSIFLCHHKAGWRMLRASSETASVARDLRVKRKIFPDVCISCFVVLVFDISLADCRSLLPMCVRSVRHLQLNVLSCLCMYSAVCVVCMSSATGTLHVLEICAIEQIRRMC